jgi:hypothetical protein
LIDDVILCFSELQVKLWQRSCHGGAVLEARIVKLGVIEDLEEWRLIVNCDYGIVCRYR